MTSKLNFFVLGRLVAALKLEGEHRVLLHREKVKRYKQKYPEKIRAQKLRHYARRKALGLSRTNSPAKENARWMRRYFQNPHLKLRSLFRSRIRSAVTKAAGVRQDKSTALLGCSVEQARAHLEQQFLPGMNWRNHGPVWHIDHIKPCALFDLATLEGQRACFHYTNLQPLPAWENLSKGAKYNG